MVIFASKTHHTNWFDNAEIPSDWTITVSDNGWTNDQLDFNWLQFMFESNTKDCMKDVYQLLILNRHNNYFTPQFNLFCIKHKIIPICMPLHSLHFLQPLNVSCFLILKHLYSCQIKQFMKYEINFIDKPDFLILYNQAYTETYLSNTIQNGFKATELVLYDSI